MNVRGLICIPILSHQDKSQGQQLVKHLFLLSCFRLISFLSSICFQIFALVYILHTPVISIVVTDPPSPEDYVYSYSIQDPTTGDEKSQHEVRKGDFVAGAYSVVGPDGTKRTVEYTADSKRGYNAVVREEPSEVFTLPLSHNFPYKVPENLIAYELVPAKIPLPYKKQQSPYFVPENKILSEKRTFEYGKFFEPVNKVVSFRYTDTNKEK